MSYRNPGKSGKNRFGGLGGLGGGGIVNMPKRISRKFRRSISASFRTSNFWLPKPIVLDFQGTEILDKIKENPTAFQTILLGGVGKSQNLNVENVCSNNYEIAGFETLKFKNLANLKLWSFDCLKLWHFETLETLEPWKSDNFETLELWNLFICK